MADTRLRVLILTHEYPAVFGGLGTHLYELATSMGQAGHSVEIRVFAPGAGPVEPQQNVTVVPVVPSHDPGSAEMMGLLHQLAIFNEDLIAHGKALLASGAPRPDVVHCHDWFMVRAAYALGELYGVPVVGTMHLLYEPCFRWWGWDPPPPIVAAERAVCVGARRLITVSHSMRELIETTYPETRGRVHVVHNGLDPRPFQRMGAPGAELEALREFMPGEGERMVLFAGRLVAQKGVGALLESTLRVAAEVPEVKYLIAGTAAPMADPPELTTFFEQHPEMKSRVRLLGKVSRQQLAALYQRASLAVIPSIYEPFGYAATEAMAAGVPVVASNVGGLSEIVVEGETGLLVPVHERAGGLREVDVERLAAAQVRLLKDEALARKFGERGRERVEKTFSLERMTRETIAVYREAIA